MSHQQIEKTPYDNLYFLGLIGLTVFFALFQIANAPLLDAVESRNGINAMEMLESGNWTQLTYGFQADVWHSKPPLSIWLTSISLKFFGFHALGLRFPMALATVMLFVFLFQLIRLYQQADFAFFSCLILLSVKGLVGRHIQDLGEYDAIFTCFAVAGTYYFLKYHDFQKHKAIYWSALCFGLSFLSKGFGVLVFLLGIIIYMLIRRQALRHLKKRNFWLGIFLFSIFPLLWLAMNSWNVSSTFEPNLYQEFLSYTLKFDTRNYFLFFTYLAEQYEWWHYLFFLSIPVGLFLMFNNKSTIEKEFTTSIQTYTPTFQAPRLRVFTIGDLLARDDLKPNIQLLLFSNCIWISLAIVCTISQNEQYLAFALPFIAITTAASIFYLNHRFEWFRYVFIALLVVAFWGQLEYYVKSQHYPPVIELNEEVIHNVNSLSIDSDLPTQDVFLYLRFIKPDLQIISGEDETSELVFCRVGNEQKYPQRQVAYEGEHYMLLLERMHDRMEL